MPSQNVQRKNAHVIYPLILRQVVNLWDQGVIYTLSRTTVNSCCHHLFIKWFNSFSSIQFNYCPLNGFRKSGFLIDGSDVNSDENVLTEIQDIFVVIDVEHFIHFDDQLETQQTHVSAISIVEDQVEDVRGI
ncbi:uncharacterized protein LOC112680493 [Sipha flava]|uniref:Uncharacterized protein LOC112680493 n=1 Tax=Sipha flava TaxID=143950 RepID=A0A8B8F6C1_9HEMI|nr:uncharacterized protein LOC112680493 [Sipha flava]